MKKIPIAASLAAVLALVPLPGAAADSAGVNFLDHDAAAGRQWKEKFGLSADQIPKFLAAMKAKDAGLQPLREQLRAGMRKLQSQLSESAPENDVQDSLQQLARTRKAISLQNDQFDAGLASFLSPSQRAKVLVWRSLGAFRGKSAQDSEGDDFHEATTGEESEPE